MHSCFFETIIASSRYAFETFLGVTVARAVLGGSRRGTTGTNAIESSELQHVSRTCICVPVSRTFICVPVSRTCICVPVSRTCILVPVYAYLYMRTCIQVPWYLVLTLGLPLCEYLPGTLVRYLPWILYLPCVLCFLPDLTRIYPGVCHRLHPPSILTSLDVVEFKYNNKLEAEQP